MINPFKKQFRIAEDIDSNGKSTFYPERTVLGVWMRHSGYDGDLEFDSYLAANKWMCYEHVATTRVHEVDEIFNKLVGK